MQMAKKAPKPVGRPPHESTAMAITIPLRLTDEIVAAVDRVIQKRGGSASRNSVLRDMIKKGLRTEGEEV